MRIAQLVSPPSRTRRWSRRIGSMRRGDRPGASARPAYDDGERGSSAMIMLSRRSLLAFAAVVDIASMPARSRSRPRTSRPATTCRRATSRRCCRRSSAAASSKACAARAAATSLPASGAGSRPATSSAPRSGPRRGRPAADPEVEARRPGRRTAGEAGRRRISLRARRGHRRGALPRSGRRPRLGGIPASADFTI